LIRFGAGGGAMSAEEALRFVSAVELEDIVLADDVGWTTAKDVERHRCGLWRSCSEFGIAKIPKRTIHQEPKLLEDGDCASECWRKPTFWHGVALSRQNRAHRLQPYQICGMFVNVPAYVSGRSTYQASKGLRHIARQFVCSWYIDVVLACLELLLL
jgi:hypothetical protein